MNGIKDWWNQNSPRDQMAMFALALAFAIYILYAIVSATHSKYIDQLEKNDRANASLSQVRELSAELLAHSEASDRSQGGNLTEQVNNSLREFNLNLSSMQPQANEAVRLRIDQANYGSVVAWLHEMEVSKGIKIKDSTITTGSEKGMISITVTLLK